MIDQSTTIVAVATATGGALSVIRLSGADALKVIATVFPRALAARQVVFGHIISPENGDIIDEVLCTYFAAPNSFTGEDVVEISCHGSAYLTAEIVRLLVLGGAEMAGAGEFSKRAFLNGKLDLSQAEAVADLISSNSAAAAAVAMRQMRGGYKIELSELRSKLLHIKSMLELEMDFGDEDVEFASRDTLRSLLKAVIYKTMSLAASFHSGNAIKNGVSVAIVGEPNAGKSTLLNALVGDERSIVSSQAGTTRDYIECHVTIQGILFRFIDTAGLREATSNISDASDISDISDVEKEGIRRSREQASLSNIVVHLIDKDVDGLRFEGDFQNVIALHGKCDQYSERRDGQHYISGKTGEGLSEFKEQLVERTMFQAGDSSEVMVSNIRHHDCLIKASNAFMQSINELEVGSPSDKICSSIDYGLSSLAEITGEVTTDEVLANIFAKFCIGK